MTRLRVLLRRLRGVLRGRRVERDLDDELNFHLQMEVDDQMRRGLSEADARAAALRRFGGVARTKEIYRETRGLPIIEVLLQDAKYGVRMLARSPGFTAVAVFSLALGIGANTAIFTLINALVLKPLPVARPLELVHIQEVGARGMLNQWTTAAFDFFHDRTELFSGVFAQCNARFNVSFGPEPTPIEGIFVSGDYFSTLGVSPMMGRGLTTADDRESGGPDGPVAVISSRFWNGRFGGDRSVLGRSMVVEGMPVRIVGVLPDWFSGVEVGKSPNIFVPLRIEPILMKQNSSLHGQFVWWLDVLARKKARLKDGAFQAGLAAVAPRLVGVLPVQKSKGAMKAPPVRLASEYAGNGISDLRKKFSQPLYILMGIAGMVLLIACANVANLLLARTSARQREVAVRLALGASRPRLLRQLLTESLLLSGLGAAAGIAFAFWGCRFLLALLTTVELNVRPDPWVLAFTAAVALATGVLFGAGPALRATSVDATSLKESSQGLGSRSRVGNLLVVSQVSLCLLLLIGAGLFIRTFWNLTNQHLGFDPHHLYVAGIDPRAAGFKDDKLMQMYAELLGKLNQRPEVQAASLSMMTPIGFCCWSEPVVVEGYTEDPSERRTILMNSVSPGYFHTFGTRLLYGRNFTERDGPTAPLAAVVSESFVKQYFGGTNPLGRHIGFVKDPHWQNVEIVGVVEDTRTRNLRASQEYEVYFSLFQTAGIGGLHVEIRTANELAAAAPLLRDEVQSFSRQIPVNVESLNEQIGKTAVSDRMTAILAGFFGSLALVLACIGLYGTMSYHVIRRTGELGIRMALGARSADVTGMILRQAVLLAAGGALIGIPAALVCARLLTSLSSLLFGLQANDPATIGAMVVLLIGLAAAAGYVPARRAAKLDPVRALRNE